MKPPEALVSWAKRADLDQEEWDRRAVDSWARTATFSHSRMWAEAEAALMAREYPPLPGRAVSAVIGGLGWIGVAFLALITAGSSVVGLALLITSEASGEAAAGDILLATYLAFIVANIASLTYLSVWWQTRRRGTFEVVVGLITSVASSVAGGVYLLMEIPDSPWLFPLILCAAMSGAVLLAVELGSRPEGRANSKKPPPRGPKREVRRAQMLRARKRLLQVMIDRGLVDLDDADLIRVGEMPLGYWSELDGLNEAEWRRVLELRHVGWRNFGAKDRKTA